MMLVWVIVGAVLLMLTAGLAVRHIQNEKKNVFLWRRRTFWGRMRQYVLAVLLASAAIVLALIVAVFCLLIPLAPGGLVRKVQNFAGYVDDHFSPP